MRHYGVGSISLSLSYMLDSYYTTPW